MSSFLSSILGAGQTAKSAVLVASGVAALARSQLSGEGAVLAFHGLCEDDEPTGVSDSSLHLKVSIFQDLCRHLSVYYHVITLREMVACLRSGEPLPDRAVALTFDDGYASNYELGFPVLRELGLPATIFMATGFIDGEAPLWFQEVDLALTAKGAAGAEGVDLGQELAQLKVLPDVVMRKEVAKLMEEVGDIARPTVCRPMTWDQAREMQRSGVVEFGAHTHTHPILSVCSLEQQRWEIETSRERLRQELGIPPRMFAYPNGGAGDWTSETHELLVEGGFDAAWTMISGRIKPGGGLMELPRYGAPESLSETEATVSGAFEMVRKWRGGAE